MSRPRDDRLDAAIHHATVSVLAEIGYEGLTIAEVARRAATVPPTLYRRYANARQLVLDALRREFAEIAAEEIADRGSLRDDLVALVGEIARELTPRRIAVLVGLLLPMRRDAELATAVRREFAFLDVASWHGIVSRAVARGELPADGGASVGLVLTHVAPAMIFHRSMLLDLPLDDAFAVEVVDTVILPAVQRTPALRRNAAPTPE